MSLRSDCLVRYARLDDCLAMADLRAPLSRKEADHLERIADMSRRRQWLAGRVIARELLGEAFDLSAADDVQIISRGENGLGSRPLVTVNARRLDCGLSISHSSRGVLVALAPGGACSLGVDLCDEVESFTPGFLRLWFTPAEQIWMGGDRLRAATIWAIKEAVFKAISHGAAWNPREIEVFPQHNILGGSAAAHGGTGFRCEYLGQTVQPLSLRLHTVDGHTAAIACQARSARIRFTVPIGSTAPSRSQCVEPIPAETFVNSVGSSPCWIST
jgi:phosphopantetheinyl transferase